jgi:hypothetical protein
VLLSLRKRYTITLRPAQISVAETAPGWRAERGATFTHNVEQAEEKTEWQASIAALRHWLEQGNCVAGNVDVILSDHFARYALVPWSGNIQNPAELATFARIQFESLYGAPTENWDILVDMSEYGAVGIGCALSRELVPALSQLFSQYRLRLASVRPYFVHVFNRSRMAITGDAIVAVAEPGQCTLGCCKDGAWHSIRTIRIDSNVESELDILIGREMLLQGLNSNTAVHLHSLEELDSTQFLRIQNLTMLDAEAQRTGKTTDASLMPMRKH